jgi:hypothetical protein
LLSPVATRDLPLLRFVLCSEEDEDREVLAFAETSSSSQQRPFFGDSLP